jgi:hypothetical protein
MVHYTKIKLSILFVILQTTLSTAQAQIPKFGNDTLIDIGCWNIEWFGSNTNGPSNTELQFSNVLNILRSTDIDVWGFSEISNNSTFNRLMDSLGVYDQVVATFSQTQRTALSWKKSMFEFISSQHILNTSQYSYDFASRPPLEVVLRTKNAPLIDTLYFYVLHLKAISDGESYTRRKNSSEHMKLYFDVNRKNDKIFVIGDWNDDLIFPTWSGANVSPFKNFVDDSLNYYFPSIELTRAGKVSYGRGSNRAMIDHQMINSRVYSHYVKNSAIVLDTLTRLVPNFVSTTSDHFPVISFYNFNVDTTTTHTAELNHQIIDARIWPNPASNLLYIQIPNAEFITVLLMDLAGRTVANANQIEQDILTIPIDATIPNGIYVLHMQHTNSTRAYHKIVISR